MDRPMWKYEVDAQPIPFRDGFEGHVIGVGVRENPFNPRTQAASARLWLAGWRQGEMHRTHFRERVTLVTQPVTR